eukprot:GFUD01105480.1.p1 GENE.GFUD01105480.1~~GFUD01105480.1.p1  ORF type:complete len:273 (+),score=31.70 GFUD01105480.1:38-856(+)
MNLVIKFPLLLMFGSINPYNPYPYNQDPYNPYPYYPQQHYPTTQFMDSPQVSSDDWWYSMGDDWEVSNTLKSISPHYASFDRMHQQMAMYAPALHVGKINREETKPPTPIPYKPIQIVSRQTGPLVESWGVLEDWIDALDFTSTSDMTFHGMTVFGGNDGVETHTGDIQLLDEFDSVLASATFSITTDGSPKYFDVLFDKPFDIKAGVLYTLSVEYLNEELTRVYYIGDAQESIEVQCREGVAVLDFSDSDYGDDFGTNADEGLIPRFIISC